MDRIVMQPNASHTRPLAATRTCVALVASPYSVRLLVTIGPPARRSPGVRDGTAASLSIGSLGAKARSYGIRL